MQETFAMHQSENVQMIYGYHYIMVSTKYYCIRIQYLFEFMRGKTIKNPHLAPR